MKVDFYKHNISQVAKDLVNEVLNSAFLTTGPKTKLFEEKFATYLGARYALGFTSWTNAGFLVLKAWGVGKGDEVIVPSMTFIATANIVLHCGAKVVFCDSELETGNMDLDKLESLITKKTKAIIGVHLYGQMLDMKKLQKIGKKYNLKIMEDCAHTIEGSRDGYKPSAYSSASVFSFYATKNITSGEGGAVVTNDKELIDSLMPLRLHGMSKSAADRYNNKYQHWDMDILGYKANMFDIQAAMLLPQLENIDETREKKEKICQYYEQEFSKANIKYPRVLEGSTSARHLFTIWVKPSQRDKILDYLQDKGIGVAVNFRAVHTLEFYKKYLKNKKHNLENAKLIGNSTITIPMYPKLTSEEIQYVAKTVIETVKLA